MESTDIKDRTVKKCTAVKHKVQITGGKSKQSVRKKWSQKNIVNKIHF